MLQPPNRVQVSTADAPAAIGPYSQGVTVGGMLWCSGQVGLGADGHIVEGGVAAETRQALRNLAEVCGAAGTRLERAVRCTVYLTDMNDFQVMNVVYAEFFAAPYPSRATVQVVALPKGGRVEIDAVVAL